VHESLPSKDRRRQAALVQLRRGRAARQEGRVRFSSSLSPPGRLPSHRSEAYVTRVWSNGAGVRACPAPTALILRYPTRRPAKRARRGLLRRVLQVGFPLRTCQRGPAALSSSGLRARSRLSWQSVRYARPRGTLSHCPGRQRAREAIRASLGRQ
jgi:hypothetical protein